MARKIMRTMGLALIVIGILSLTLGIRRAEASGIVFIRADGRVEPSATPVLSLDNVTYTFTDTVYDPIEVERDNIIIDGAGHTLQGSGGYNGLTLFDRENVTIKNTDIEGFGTGVYVNVSSGITISRCKVANNNYGIHLAGSSNNTVYRCNVTLNTEYGVLINLLSTNNFLFGNNVANNEYGFLLDYSSEYNTLIENTIADNIIGVASSFSSNNRIFHNDFMNNTAQALTEASLNIWDDGYPSGGNYWSNYADVDNYNGPYQNETGSDGILDHPYEVDVDNKDNYPLAEPLPPEDVTPPSIIIISPENKTYAITDVALTFAVDEPVSWMSYSLDSGSNVNIAGNTTLALTEGLHSIMVYANDTAGNMGSSERVHFSVDITPPSITGIVQSPDKNNVHPSDKVKVNSTVADTLSGVKQVFLNYTTDNVTWFSTIMTNIAGGIFNATIPEFPDGTDVTYVVIAEDNAGNVASSAETGYISQYHVIPEFASLIILALFMMATLLAVMIQRRRHSQQEVS